LFGENRPQGSLVQLSIGRIILQSRSSKQGDHILLTERKTYWFVA
jgi:hypothetical protein